MAKVDAVEVKRCLVAKGLILALPNCGVVLELGKDNVCRNARFCVYCT